MKYINVHFTVTVDGWTQQFQQLVETTSADAAGLHVKAMYGHLTGFNIGRYDMVKLEVANAVPKTH